LALFEIDLVNRWPKLEKAEGGEKDRIRDQKEKERNKDQSVLIGQVGKAPRPTIQSTSNTEEIITWAPFGE